MEIHWLRRARATSLALLFVLAAGTARAETLLLFDFEDAAGDFETTPALLHAGITTATWSAALGAITDFSGNPGRALAISGFPEGNRLHLALAIAPGLLLQLERLRFDLRASATGPTGWTLALAGLTLAAGPTTTAFTSVDTPLTAAAAAGALVLEFAGSGATAAAGNLRLDNVELFGTLVPAPVPLPGPLFLLLTPMLGLALGQARRHLQRKGGEPGAQSGA